MKKIVAIVLSLVMVLGLATTAFGAVAPANYYAANDLTTALGDATTNTYSLEAYTTGAAAAKTFDQVALWAVNKTTGAKTLVNTFVVAVSATSADFAFVNGTQITYLNSFGSTYTATASVKPVVAIKDVAKCGDVFVGGDVPAYVDAAGVVYVEAAGAASYNVDGKLATLVPAATMNTSLEGAEDAIEAEALTAGMVYTVIHTMAADTATAAGKAPVVTKVFCSECKGEFEFLKGTEAQAIAKFGAGNYTTFSGVYVALVPGAAAAADSAVVESAQTFDAGIAMYVGMSVMAAAGSAVVLKKKD